MTATGTQDSPRTLKLPPIPEGQKIILNNPAGAAIEDKNGVLLAIRLPNVFEDVQVCTFLLFPVQPVSNIV